MATCGADMFLCEGCRPLTLNANPPVCASCWRAGDQMCILCSSHRARHHFSVFRCCQRCHFSCFCSRCNAAPVAAAPSPCRSCMSRRALWCKSCCSDAELSSGLCRVCFLKAGVGCHYCHQIPGASVCAWRQCLFDGCGLRVFTCGGCLGRAKGNVLSCLTCWGRHGRCIVCDETPARTERAYARL